MGIFAAFLIIFLARPILFLVHSKIYQMTHASPGASLAEKEQQAEDFRRKKRFHEAELAGKSAVAEAKLKCNPTDTAYAGALAELAIIYFDEGKLSDGFVISQQLLDAADMVSSSAGLSNDHLQIWAHHLVDQGTLCVSKQNCALGVRQFKAASELYAKASGTTTPLASECMNLLKAAEATCSQKPREDGNSVTGIR